MEQAVHLYRSGCFRRSAQAFQESSSFSSTTIPLHRLAWDADAALARYRAAVGVSPFSHHTTTTTTTTRQLWEAALDANAAYRQGLLPEMPTVMTRLTTSPNSRHNRRPSHQQECVSWAYAMLMASVSEVWLMIQQVPSSNHETNREDESTHIQMRLARAALNEGIGLASHCFIINMSVSVEEETHCLTTNQEGLADYNDEQYKWLERHLTRHNNERGRVVWRTVQMTRNAIFSIMSDTTTTSASSMSRMSGPTKKRRRLDDVLVPVDPQRMETPPESPHLAHAASSQMDHFHSKSTSTIMDEENVPLRVQELVIEALAWHNYKSSPSTATTSTLLSNSRPKIPSSFHPASTTLNENDDETKDPKVTTILAIDATPVGERQNQPSHILDKGNPQRDQCLEDAISLDPSLQTHFGNMAHTLRILFRALAALAATPIRTTTATTTMTEHELSALFKDLKSMSLRKGGVPSSIRLSRVALHLMGCLYAQQRGDVSKALHAFQGALELDESSSLGSSSVLPPASNDISNDNGAGSPEHRETIESMVQCFTALGRNEPAVELLLYLLQKQAPIKSDEEDMNATPSLASNHGHMGTTLVISNSGVSTLSSLSLLQSDSDESHGSQKERRRILCQLFSCASCTNDWATCLAVAKELCQDDKRQHHSHHGWSSASECAHVFALLQAGRPTLALSLLEETTKTTTTCHQERSMMGHEAVVLSQTTDPSRLDGLAKILMLLYTSDAIISTEQGFHDDIVQMNGPNTNNDDGENNRSGISKVNSLMKMAVVMLEKIRNDSTNKNGKLGSVLDDLEIAVKTNRGIALIMAGKPMGAIECFQEASICSCRRSKNGPTSSFSSISTIRLEPHVNLFLSLWKHEYHNDAARVWLRARDMDNNIDESTATNHNSYSARLNKTIQEYALLMVDQQQHQKAAKDKSVAFVEGSHIPSWVAEQKGTTSQLLALDIIALRHVLASQTKHAAKSRLRL